MNALIKQHLIGQRIVAITNLRIGADEVLFHTDKGAIRMAHKQQCCSSGYLDDFEGDPSEFVGAELVSFEESASEPEAYYQRDFYWVFYKFKSTKGYLDLKFYSDSGQTGMYSSEIYITWIPLTN